MLRDGLLGRRLIFNSGGSLTKPPRLIQLKPSNNTGAGTSHTDLDSVVVAGRLLILVASKNSGGGVSIDGGNVFLHGGTTARGFTKFATDVFSATDSTPAAAYDPIVIGYRIATGDEQHLDLYNGNKFVIYEYADAGDPTTFEVQSLSLQGASSAKALPAFSDAGGAQVMGIVWGNSSTTISLNQVLGAGYTEDAQYASGAGGNGHPGFIVGHGSTGAQAQVTSGQSAVWGGMAVGIRGAAI